MNLIRRPLKDLALRKQLFEQLETAVGGNICKIQTKNMKQNKNTNETASRSQNPRETRDEYNSRLLMEQSPAAKPAHTERLPASWHDCEVAEKQILDLHQQRDELLAACKELISARNQNTGAGLAAERVAVESIRAAIASAERGQQ
jgi:hypothetical protein